VACSLSTGADNGDVLITKENSAGSVVGVADEVVLPGTACDTVTLPDDASELLIENPPVGAIGVYPDGACTGTELATVPALGTGRRAADAEGQILPHEFPACHNQLLLVDNTRQA
jgi:hypothetical protein